ncbi:dipicolinate synthase subunit B [Jeotgalibacillus haloalkalitolerans]|uniref:Dipicolinate synthase subunit B n=1 Tax=Jeotgalibacillus haloalkalitolerans TaxID=3104292 RepID=A0ABU5KKI3_9BACL|nr:dipicolinate synthase subunit B [Jeotgalibacillus sp. HH7-29]MDZ5711772.1 dipicolinate synthase subunit B [Jeotgalibacillus sp. HH7-29]
MLEGKRIGFGFTGSHCTYHLALPQLIKLKEMGADIIPVVSFTMQTTNTRFGEGEEWVKKIEKAAGHPCIRTIAEAEPLGPATPLDCMVIAPLTGNSLAKLANALTDSPVLMAAKATMRNHKPVVTAISTNDGLGLNGMNLMKLMAAKNLFFVPFSQDDPENKPNSLVAHMEEIPETVVQAIKGRQHQPVITLRSLSKRD